MPSELCYLLTEVPRRDRDLAMLGIVYVGERGNIVAIADAICLDFLVSPYVEKLTSSYNTLAGLIKTLLEAEMMMTLVESKTWTVGMLIQQYSDHLLISEVTYLYVTTLTVLVIHLPVQSPVTNKNQPTYGIFS
ncbi:uncharacterized protein CTRU02_215806 [Colletotrichum truncatum]|uniref:Uncharacterized protein n=1 Tax=Colletotrichum truncatum TaxID=5467 RepID=A0ACC3YBR8_COLTU